MHFFNQHLLGRVVCILAAAVAPACGKAKSTQPAAATTAPQAKANAAKPTPMPVQTGTPVGNVTSSASEHVATGKAQPAADRPKGEDPNQAVYHGKPQMQLDSKTLADVRSTIEQTCQLLEEGVDLLEKYAKTPEKAAKAIDKYREKNANRIQSVFKAAADVRARLRSVGYDQDIPNEVRPAFEKRMGAIQSRLETMRSTYRKHRNVLETFGQLFPRTR